MECPEDRQPVTPGGCETEAAEMSQCRLQGSCENKCFLDLQARLLIGWLFGGVRLSKEVQGMTCFFRRQVGVFRAVLCP